MLDLTFEAPKPKVISGAKSEWELVIGLEVHAQVASKAKLFSGASTEFGAEPNSNVAFVDAAMPGMLPVINEFCVAQAVKTGLGLKAAINLVSAFDRKNYFYPDLPQATRFRSPTTRSSARAKSSSTWGRAWRALCASNASTWNRTRASRSMILIPTCPSSTSTAPAWR